MLPKLVAAAIPGTIPDGLNCQFSIPSMLPIERNCQFPIIDITFSGAVVTAEIFRAAIPST